MDTVKIEVIERLSSQDQDNSIKTSTMKVVIPERFADKINKTIFIHTAADTREHKLSDISSTRVRKALSTRPSTSSWFLSLVWCFSSDAYFLRDVLHPKVLQYIIEHDLYRLSSSADDSAL